MKSHEQIIYDYCKNKGAFLICTSDSAFIGLLKSVIFSITGNKNLVSTVNDFSQILEIEKNLLIKHKQLIIFIEKYFYGEITLEKIKYIKEICSLNCKIICICNEADQATFTQIYEMGADNIIIKPISIGSLIEKINTVITSDTSIKEFILLCEKSFLENDFDSAQYYIDQIFSKKPHSCIGYMLFGDLLKLQGKYQEAEQKYLLAIDRASLFLDPLKRMVSLYEDTNNLEKKLEYLIKLDLLSPLNYKRKIEIGSAFTELNQIEKAEYYFGETVRHIKNQALEHAASVLMDISKSIKDKNIDLSLKYIKEAIYIKKDNLNESDIWMFIEMGILLRRQKRWEDAITCYNSALKINPNKGSLYYNIGMALYEGKRYIDSIRNFELALKFSPTIINDSPIISYNIACVYNILNDKTSAVYYLTRCLEIDPNYENAILLLNKIRGTKT